MIENRVAIIAKRAKRAGFTCRMLSKRFNIGNSRFVILDNGRERLVTSRYNSANDFIRQGRW